MDPEPAKHCAEFRGAEASAGGPGGGPARPPGLTGGGAEVLACIVPGREPCFLLPGTPRWRLGARGRSAQGPVVSGEGVPSRGGEREELGPGSACLRSRDAPPCPSRLTRRRREEGQPRRETVPGSAPPTLAAQPPMSVGARRDTIPKPRLGRRRAGRRGLPCSHSLAVAHRAPGPGPLDLRGLGPPQSGALRSPPHRWRA